jgi:hypothetical protein
MMTPNMGNLVPDDRVFAIDTGCYSTTGPRDFDEQRYFAYLERWRSSASRCLFATAPDAMGDAAATVKLSLPVLPMIRELGYRAALVAQPGAESLALPWDAFDVLFMGGGPAWKWTEPAFELAAEAKRRGKWLHMGAVNGLKKLRAAEIAGFDSADGTFVAFGGDANVAIVEKWIAQIKRQPTLWGKA